MLLNGLAENPAQSRNHSIDKRALTESVAYALWQERRRRDVPDDPDADWYHAEELVLELWNHRAAESE